MAVAKSYQNLEFIGDVFSSSGRQYIKVRMKNGTIKTVRWYTEKEYAKMYPEATKDYSKDPYYKPQKDVLGFDKGYITIFKGDVYSHLDWFRASIARCARHWGWYIISTEEVPLDLPEGIEPVRLPWALVGNEDGKLKPEHLVKEGVDSILYTSSNSTFQGSIGERLELFLVVEKTTELEGEYGHSITHLMKDNNGNSYIWTTSAKNWAVGTKHHIRGTIKEHKKIKNECQNILTRCVEIKK